MALSVVGAAFGQTGTMSLKLALEPRIHERDHGIGVYKRHNARVRERIAPDRPLVYEVADGRAPLCAFLGVPIPDAPMPQVNTTEEFQTRQSRSQSPSLTPMARPPPWAPAREEGRMKAAPSLILTREAVEGAREQRTAFANITRWACGALAGDREYGPKTNVLGVKGEVTIIELTSFLSFISIAKALPSPGSMWRRIRQLWRTRMNADGASRRTDGW